MKVPNIAKTIIKTNNKQNDYKFYKYTRENIVNLLNDAGMMDTKSAFDGIDAFVVKQGKNLK